MMHPVAVGIPLIEQLSLHIGQCLLIPGVHAVDAHLAARNVKAVCKCLNASRVGNAQLIALDIKPGSCFIQNAIAVLILAIICNGKIWSAQCIEMHNCRCISMFAGFCRSSLSGSIGGGFSQLQPAFIVSQWPLRRNKSFSVSLYIIVRMRL